MKFYVFTFPFKDVACYTLPKTVKSFCCSVLVYCPSSIHFSFVNNIHYICVSVLKLACICIRMKIVVKNDLFPL